MKQIVSNLIPEGKGQNIAEFYKNGTRTEGIFSKQAREESKKKHSMIKCDCCSRLVPGVIIETGGVRDDSKFYPWPLPISRNSREKMWKITPSGIRQSKNLFVDEE